MRKDNKKQKEESEVDAYKVVGNVKETKINEDSDKHKALLLQFENLSREKECIKKELLFIEEEREYIKKQRSYLESIRVDLNKKESELLNKEITIGEQNKKEYEKAIETLNGTIAKLKSEAEKNRKILEELNYQIDITKREKQLNVDKEISKYKEAKIREIEKEYQNKMIDLEKELDSIKKLHSETLKVREAEINKRELDLEEKIKKYVEKYSQIKDKEETFNNSIKERELNLKDFENELKLKKKEYDYESKWLDKERESLQNQVNQKVEERSLAIQESYERKIESLNKLVVEHEKTIEELENIRLKSGNKGIDELAADIQFKDNLINDLKEKLSKYPTKDIIIELQEKAIKFRELEEEIDTIRKEKSKLENERHKWIMTAGEVEALRDEANIEKKRREAISVQIEKYKEEVESLKPSIEKPMQRAKRVEVIETPVLEIMGNCIEDDVSEIKWLDSIHKKCEESGINFNRRLLNAFHTALKISDWSPLTVLGGVSGTGKSELPRLYSRFGGMNYISLPVQPDWDSPQSLIGYFNSIDNRFNPTELLRAMVQCQSSNNDRIVKDSVSDKMLLVLLDEMNLAHVELYFSDLLSKLESRRGKSDPEYIELDLGADEPKYKVELSRNILWAGTMNEDETTKSLSDKVLDRGNFISFPRPVKFERRKKMQLAEKSHMLKRVTWNKWLNDRIDFNDELDKYKECLEAINGHLEIVGRALGHRVWQAIESYISNHPMVIEAYKDDSDLDIDRCIQLSFEEALVYKVMPKLRGIETDGDSRHKCLNQIKKRLTEVLPGSSILEDFDIACQSAYGIFTWKSAKYLEENYGE